MVRSEYFYARFDEEWAVGWKYDRSEFMVIIVTWGKLSKGCLP